MPRLPDPPKNVLKPEENRMPLEMIAQKIARDLLLVFAGNGFKGVAFSLIVTDPATDETTIAGNLKVPGIKEQISIVLGKIVEQEKERFRESLGLPPDDASKNPQQGDANTG